ncbi:MAG: hypothetical protein AB1371_04290 [Pseudomonadota bacterium]
MDRRRYLRAAAVAAMAAAASGIARGPLAWGQPSVRLLWQADAALKVFPVLLALRLGFFHAEGVAVAAGPWDARTQPPAPAPGAGTVRVLAGDFDTVLRQHARGQAEQAFLALARTPLLGLAERHIPDAVDAPPLAWPNARIGILASHALPPRIVALALQRQGLTARAGQLVALADTAQIEAALQDGRLDAVCIDDPLLTRLQRRGAIRVVIDTRQWSESQRLVGGAMVGACLSVATSQVATHGAELQATARAVQRALRWLQTASPLDLADHADLAGFAGDATAFLAVFAQMRESYSPDGAVGEPMVLNTLRVWQALPFGAGDDRLAPTRLYTPRFVATADAPGAPWARG